MTKNGREIRRIRHRKALRDRDFGRGSRGIDRESGEEV